MQSTSVATRQREVIPLDPLTPELLAEVVRRIVEAVDPDKIILFGSYARGTPHEYSDIDLYIIKSGDDNRFELQGEIHEVRGAPMALPLLPLCICSVRLAWKPETLLTI